MNAEPNLVHKKVSDIFEKAIPSNSNSVLLRDTACGGKQHIPLFYSAKKSRRTEYCNVDLLLLKNNKIRIIAEIEESNVKPTQICGKFLTSALSRHYIRDSEANKPVEMADSVLFIQIVDTSKLVRNKTAKYAQWKALEKSINRILPIKDSNIISYRLLTTDDLTELDAIIQQNLQ
jgi:hypothetical protein